MTQASDNTPAQTPARSEPEGGRDFTAGRRASLRAFKIAAIYALCGFLWITASDRLLALFVRSSALLTQFQTYKGWVFIFITAALVYALTRRDLLEPERLAGEMRESEDRFRAVFEKSRDAIGISRAGTHVFVNPAYLALFGFPPDADLAGRSILDLIAPASRDRVLEYIRLREAGGPVPPLYEIQGLRSDGTSFDMEVAASSFRERGGDYTLVTLRDVTHRKKADEALKRSESALRDAQQIAAIGSWRFEVDAGRLWWSDELYRIFGIEPSAGGVSPEILFSRVHPDDRETFRSQVMSRVPHRLEYRVVMPDGKIKYIHEEVRVERDDRGTVVLMHGTAQDITERRKIEDELRKNEKMLQTIFDAEPECVKVLDQNSCLIMMNRAGLDMLEADSLGQIKGRCVCPMVTSAYRREFMDLTRRVFQGESATLSFEMIGLKGRHLWMETHAVPLRNEKEEIVALLAVTRDITARMRVEEKLREKDAKYRLLFESANDGIFIQDETGFLDCNLRGAEMYGLKPEGVIGHLPGEFAPERQPDGRLSSDVAGEKIQAAMSGIPQVFEWQPARADGSLFDVEITLSRIELGGKACLQAIVRDIGERKRLEQERLKTQKLESIGTLAGGIAHDFNNLLQGVFGYISMAKISFGEKEKALAMLEQAEKALHQSVNLTNQLLTFSKGGRPVKKTIALRPVVEKAVKFSLSGSRLDYRINVDEPLFPVDADEGQITQVIQNIVLNADQAMPLGGKIEIRARNVRAHDSEMLRGLKKGEYVAISIKDAGIGIPGQFLPRIFDPYFTTKEKGSGLGLATSYSIVKNHGGVIDVESTVGKGATFTIYLPAAKAVEAAAPAPAPPASSGRRGRVLVMDDEELVRTAAGALIRFLGHEAELAENSATAVGKYLQAREASRPFDLVILDLTIRGGTGGLETLRKLREIDPAVKAVVSSGYSDDSVTADYELHGFQAFLKKPYDLESLQDVLNKLLT